MTTTTNLKEVAYQHLKTLIIDGALEEGVVYSERNMSAEIGVSRTPFHSALQQLESEGYVDILPSRGFSLHHLSAREVEETFEVRSAIEFFSVYSLAEDYAEDKPESKSTVADLRDLLKEMRRIYDTSAKIEDFVVYDFEFHNTIVHYKNNPTFDSIYSTMMYKIKKLAHESLAHEGRMENTLSEHEAIIDAVESGNRDTLCEVTMRHFNTPKYINLQDIIGPI